MIGEAEETPQEKGKTGKPEDPGGDHEGSCETKALTGSGAAMNKMQIWAESRMEEVAPERLRDEVFSVLGASWGCGPTCIGL